MNVSRIVRMLLVGWLTSWPLWLAVPTCDGQQHAATPLTLQAQQGYDRLLHKAFLPADFDQETFDQVWKVWPEPLRSQAEKASLRQRREMAFARYGLTPRPGDPQGRPLQYVVDDQGRWSMNCFACHGGQVNGQVIAGLPNAHYALETLTAEIRRTKLRLGKPLGRMDMGSLVMPLGSTNGTTNAVMFGVVLMGFRDAQLNLVSGRSRADMVHHDMDAPPWWNVKKRERLYIDGFAEKGHRALMPFLLVRDNGPETIKSWEEDFRLVQQYIHSLEAPRYPFTIDGPLARSGERVFLRHCASCHGTYGDDEDYPHVVVPIEEIGTDPVRLAGLSEDYRRRYGESWFAHEGQQETVINPEGYLAPPLDGVWASAPYLHNGSVPTLWHLLHPDQRPEIWRRDPNGYDRVHVGLKFTAHDDVPLSAQKTAARREYFDTRLTGKSRGGHLYPNKLTEAEKRAVLEYLKSL